jgi:hypothetical protein
VPAIAGIASFYHVRLHVAEGVIHGQHAPAAALGAASWLRDRICAPLHKHVVLDDFLDPRNLVCGDKELDPSADNIVQLDRELKRAHRMLGKPEGCTQLLQNISS